MSDTITLTREEVQEAQRDMCCDIFLGYVSRECEFDDVELPAFCRLCKRLTEFAEGEEER